MFKYTAAACAASLTAAVATTASAQTIISNLSASTVSSTFFGPGGTTVFKAGGFTMGGSSFGLMDAVLTLDGTAGGQPIVSIYSDAAGAPGAQLALLSGGPIGALGNYSFVPNAPFTLEANTTYWLYVVDSGTGGNFSWISTNADPSGPHATWVGYNFNGNPSSFQNFLEINAVPGPATAGLFAAAGLFAVRRRR